MNLVLKIYDDSGKNIVKSYESKTYDLMFGTVMKLMELLKVEDMDDQLKMLKTIYGAWEEIKTVLAGVFPEATDDDWKHVRVKELLPLIMKIAKLSVTEVLTIPIDEKN
ncbi:MAG: hypothetical protein IIZ73_10005 [Ruminococcus sp.]|nr:hypothetical protein [Ruminococcus sp.]